MPCHITEEITNVTLTISLAKQNLIHTKIREYVLNYDNTEPWDGDVTDFDVASYYDSVHLDTIVSLTQVAQMMLHRLKAGANSQYNS